MKALVATIAIVACCCCVSGADAPRKLVEFPVDRSVVDIDNGFSRNNPFYKQRAGAFYEIKYVAPSAEALFRIAGVRPEQMPGTLDALRAFVYEWLDLYVRGNGAIGQAEIAKCIARMDERFDSLFDYPLQRKLYRVWRDDASNQLRFLMVSPGVDNRKKGTTQEPGATEPDVDSAPQASAFRLDETKQLIYLDTQIGPGQRRRFDLGQGSITIQTLHVTDKKLTFRYTPEVEGGYTIYECTVPVSPQPVEFKINSGGTPGKTSFDLTKCKLVKSGNILLDH